MLTPQQISEAQKTLGHTQPTQSGATGSSERINRLRAIQQSEAKLNPTAATDNSSSSTPSTPPVNKNTEQPTAFNQMSHSSNPFTSAAGELGNIVSGGIKGAARTAQSMSSLGQKILYPGQEKVNLPEVMTKATGTAQQGAIVGEQVGELLGPAGISKVSRPVEAGLDLFRAGKNIASNLPKISQEIAVGKEGIKTLSKIANPEAKAFVPVEKGGAGKTFSSVLEGTKGAVGSFIAKSKSSLQAVKQAIPKGIEVGKEKVSSAVNDGILKSLKKSAEYHGVSGVPESIFKTPEDLVNSGVLTSEEAARVKGIVKVVRNWDDTSARGVLNLKEQLSSFYKDGFNGSNNILRGIQSNLKDLVAEVHPEIKPALEKASANIDKAEEFTKHLLGTNPTTGESKLASLAKNLKDPALKGYQHSLLDDLKQATGHDVLPELKGYADYLDLLKKDFPKKSEVILKNVAKRLGITAVAGTAAEETKRLLGGG